MKYKIKFEKKKVKSPLKSTLPNLNFIFLKKSDKKQNLTNINFKIHLNLKGKLPNKAIINAT